MLLVVQLSEINWIKPELLGKISEIESYWGL